MLDLDIQKFADVEALLIVSVVWSGLLPILIAKNKDGEDKTSYLDFIIDRLNWPTVFLITSTICALLYVWKGRETLFGFTFLEFSYILVVVSVVYLLLLWILFVTCIELRRMVKTTVS